MEESLMQLHSFIAARAIVHDPELRSTIIIDPLVSLDAQTRISGKVPFPMPWAVALGIRRSPTELEAGYRLRVVVRWYSPEGEQIVDVDKTVDSDVRIHQHLTRGPGFPLTTSGWYRIEAYAAVNDGELMKLGVQPFYVERSEMKPTKES